MKVKRKNKRKSDQNQNNENKSQYKNNVKDKEIVIIKIVNDEMKIIEIVQEIKSKQNKENIIVIVDKDNINKNINKIKIDKDKKIIKINKDQKKEIKKINKDKRIEIIKRNIKEINRNLDRDKENKNVLIDNSIQLFDIFCEYSHYFMLSMFLYYAIPNYKKLA